MPDATKVRAKFKVESMTRFASFNGGAIVLNPVYSNDPAHENKQFWNATPNGKIEMNINNPIAFERFEIGREYYVDFTCAD